ncbi:MAG: bifunctional demethylmenaquinone methyltransferase/2-methoxy-6-polyprenyl-1,4-benzoquinol methylase UbiE [Cellvibrionaceae bacterium]
MSDSSSLNTNNNSNNRRNIRGENSGQSPNEGNDTTHFGFEQVKAAEKAGRVAGVFHSVAAQYDVMNDFMTAGIHRLWKRYTIEAAAARPGQRILDIAGGTGDLTIPFSRIVGEQGQVVLADINDSMLNVGRDRLTDKGIVGNVVYLQTDAQFLPFPDNTFDCITIAFGLRNVTDKDLALASMLRILKPGGRLLILEFSKPKNDTFARIYDKYSFNILPAMGKIIANDPDSYRYLAESIRMHPNQETLKEMMNNAGFINTQYTNMTGGIVALHKGFKA